MVNDFLLAPHDPHPNPSPCAQGEGLSLAALPGMEKGFTRIPNESDHPLFVRSGPDIEWVAGGVWVQPMETVSPIRRSVPLRRRRMLLSWRT